MEQRLSFITLGVENLDMMKKWYMDTFGWVPSHDSDGIVFFTLNGFIFSLFPAHELAEDIGIQNDGAGFKRFTTSINLNSTQEIDELFDSYREKGITILKEPQKTY